MVRLKTSKFSLAGQIMRGRRYHDQQYQSRTDATVSKVNSNTGAIEDINVTQNGFDFLAEDVAEINSVIARSGHTAGFYDGFLTIEANSTFNDSFRITMYPQM